MNLGGLTAASPDAKLRRAVLHEFGHALGLVHEHQNPGRVMHWNREQVITDLSGPPYHWTAEMIEMNMFEAYKEDDTTFTRLDPQSIMMYPIPVKWTTDGFFTQLNPDLSPTDRSFIRAMYK
jgi:hypothetical protein